MVNSEQNFGRLILGPNVGIRVIKRRTLARLSASDQQTLPLRLIPQIAQLIDRLR